MMKKLLIAASMAATASMSMAAAAPMMSSNQVMNPWYVGIGANYNAQSGYKTTNAAGATTDKNKSNNLGGQIFAGYQINQYFGAEVGGVMLGNQKETVTGGTVTYKNMYNVHVVGTATLNVTNWFDVFGDAGMAYMNAKKTSTAGTGLGSNQANSFGLVYGAGFGFNFNQFGIRAAYNVQAPANTDGDSFNSQDYVSLDVLYRFQG